MNPPDWEEGLFIICARCNKKWKSDRRWFEEAKQHSWEAGHLKGDISIMSCESFASETKKFRSSFKG